MKKIWLVISNGSYRSKQKIYKTESTLLKAIDPTKDQEIIEYDMVSSIQAKDFINARNRDTQLRAVLGELDLKEESAIQLVRYYEKVAPDGRNTRNWRTNVVTTEKQKMISELEKFQTNKKAFASILTKHKKHFITVCSDVEWYKLLLGCHNFRDHVYDRQRWEWNDSRTKRIPIKVDTSTEEVRNNFKEAKKQLRKK